MPWYKEWTGVPPNGDNIKYVYAELTGRVTPWDLFEDFGVTKGRRRRRIRRAGRSRAASSCPT